MADSQKEYVVRVEEMRQFVVKSMASVGTDAQHAAQLADCLIHADLRGHYSHGLNRLHIYIEDTLGNVAKSGAPTIVRKRGGTAFVDGRNLLGPVVGNFCTELAIELAKEQGVAWVVCKGSNHFGIAGHYSTKIAAAGLMGLSFTNSSPCFFPTRSSEQGLGSNPISCAAPARDGDSFVLDMATSTVAFGKIELAQTKGQPTIPLQWGARPDGVPTEKPSEVLQGGGLLPLGGIEETGGYKGTGLAAMVEIFCGGLAGTSTGKRTRLWRESTSAANLAQCFIAVDPSAFAGGFETHLQQFLDDLRNSKPIEADKPVLVAGDPERFHEQRSHAAGGLIYGQRQLDQLKSVAAKYSIPMFEYKEIH